MKKIKIKGRIKSKKLEKYLKRPWGGFICFAKNKPCTVKIRICLAF